MSHKNNLSSTDRIEIALWYSQIQAAENNPWLASIMLKRSRRLGQRLAYYYDWLANLPRRWRRRIQRAMATGLLGAALLLAMGSSPTVQAATIAVGGGCTLRDAITSANTDTAMGSCTAGSGADTIVLSGRTYSYSAAYGTNSALPDITSEITIEGNGATISRSIAGPSFRILKVTASGDLTLNNSTITGGYHSPVVGNGLGGGIYNSGMLTLNSSVVSNNRTTRDDDFGEGGGGIYNNGTLTLNDSTISSNSAENGGGGILNVGTADITSTSISDNSGAYGGGIFQKSGALTINNGTISGNSASGGGGILQDGGALTINNSTISKNHTDFAAGGIFQPGGSLTLNHCLVSGNNANSSANEIAVNYGPIEADNYNLFGDSSQSTAQAVSGFTPGASDITATSDGTNPTALGSILDTTLADNGGPTLTHALISGSPAIDVSPSGLSTDQRGVSRPLDGDGVSGAAFDIGAVEMGTIICGIQEAPEPATFNFGDMSVVITDDGTDLDCVRTSNIPHDHPGAISGTDTGQYWNLDGLQSDQVTPATVDFLFNLTLPHSVSPSSGASVCKNTGGSTWVCKATGADATNVWLDGIADGFSDWAVGDNVPTAVSLLSFSAECGAANVGAIGALPAGVAAAFLGIRRLLRR